MRLKMARHNSRVDLRRALRERRFVAAPGACDPFTALIIERAGCSAIYLGGNAMAIARGKPQPLLSLDDTVDCTMRVTRVVDVPVIVDLGSGFGEPAHVHRAVRDLETAGAAALHIDDQPYPKRFDYHRAGGRGGAVPIEVAAMRLRTAVAARRDPDMIIIARTDALRETKSLDTVIERGRAYSDTGIDALMVLDLEPEQAPRIAEALPGLPLIWIGGVVPPIPSTTQIEHGGFAIAVYPFNTLAAIAATVTKLWGDFPATGTVSQKSDELLAMRGEIPRIVDIETYWAIE
ncbi:MAG: isocitrate lyase/PEP mutase family protein, partial [Burkholderiales bacterium]